MKTIGTNITYATRLFLSLCVCVSTGLTATGSQDAAIANGILKALTPPAGTETASLLNSAKEVHFHLPSNSQATPMQAQQQTAQQPAPRGFFAALFIQHPILCITAVTATVGTGAYFIRSVLHKRRIEAEQTRLANLLVGQGQVLAAVQTTQAQHGQQLTANGQALQEVRTVQNQHGEMLAAQSEGLRQQGQTLTLVQTGVSALQTGQIRQGELLTSQAQTMNTIQGTQAEQGRTLQSLATTVTDGFKANAVHQQKNDEAIAGLSSQMGQNTAAVTTLNSNIATFRTEQQQAFEKRKQEEAVARAENEKREKAEKEAFQRHMEQLFKNAETGSKADMAKLAEQLAFNAATADSRLTALEKGQVAHMEASKKTNEELQQVRAGLTEVKNEMAGLSQNAARCADGIAKALRKPTHQNLTINVGTPNKSVSGRPRVRVRSRKQPQRMALESLSANAWDSEVD